MSVARNLVACAVLCAGLVFAGAGAIAADEPGGDSDIRPTQRGLWHDIRCLGVMRSMLGEAGCAIGGNSLLVAGSTAFTRYAPGLERGYQKTHPDIHMTFGGGNALAGIIAVQRRAIDIAVVARDLVPHEYSIDTQLYLIGKDAIGIAVNPANPVDGITFAQAAAIFRGEIRDWAAVGGTPGPIHVFTRAANSATLQSLEDLLLAGEDISGSAKTFPDAVALGKAITDDPQGVGFLALHDAQSGGRLLKINGVPMERETILSGRYPISRPLYLLAGADAGPAVRDFIAFVTSPNGQGLMETNGAIRVR